MDPVWQGAALIATALTIITGIWTAISLYRSHVLEAPPRFRQIEPDIIRLVREIRRSEFNPDLILCVGRGGSIIGGLLAGNLGSVPIETIERIHLIDSDEAVEFPEIQERFGFIKEKRGKDISVLIVDGATTTGYTLRKARKIIHEILPEWETRYAVLYCIKSSGFTPDFASRILEKVPERYPWHITTDYKRFTIRRDEKNSISIL